MRTPARSEPKEFWSPSVCTEVRPYGEIIKPKYLTRIPRRPSSRLLLGPGNLIMAVSKRLVADKTALSGFDGEVIPFAEVIPSKKVLEARKRIANVETR